MNVKEIKAREEAATPGKWEWNTDRYRGGYSGITGKDNAEVLFPNHCNDGDDGAAWFEDFPNDADRDFIAHAREDIPALLAENERLQKELEAAKEDIQLGIGCATCLHNPNTEENKPICKECSVLRKHEISKNGNWKWRGIEANP